MRCKTKNKGTGRQTVSCICKKYLQNLKYNVRIDWYFSFNIAWDSMYFSFNFAWDSIQLGFVH